MKRLLFALAASAAVVSCTTGPANTYEINGTVSGYDKPVEKVYLREWDKVIDSAAVVDGKFTFKGAPDSARVFNCMLAGTKKGHMLLIDRGSVVTVEMVKGKPFTAHDGAANCAYYHNEKHTKDLTASLSARLDSLEKSGVSEEEMDKAIESAMKSLEEHTRKFLDANKDNLAGAAVFQDEAYKYETIAEFDSVAAMIKYANRFPGIEKIRNILVNRENTSAGKKFVDFKGKDLDGKESSFSDYIGTGKYVLVDFWASWCGPCRGEIPNLIKVHKKYAGKDFTVLGVNVWDQDETFRKALKEEKIKYPQIYASHDKTATDLYGINGIPQIMLIGPDGVIIERNLRGERVEAAVKKALGK